MKKNLDSLDKELISLLSKDGRTPVSDLVAHLDVTTPTVRSRIKNLIKSGMLKIAGMINTENHQELITALIGINVQSYGKIDEVLEKTASLDQVSWAAVVTGRYDIFVEVLVSGGMRELHFLITNLIPKVGRVTQSETFVITKPKRKWISPPQGLNKW